jgi:hypothetical protein
MTASFAAQAAGPGTGPTSGGAVYLVTCDMARERDMRFLPAVLWADLHAFTAAVAGWTDSAPVPPDVFGPLWPDALAQQLPEVVGRRSDSSD